MMTGKQNVLNKSLNNFQQTMGENMFNDFDIK